jgi:hypothetical protein
MAVLARLKAHWPALTLIAVPFVAYGAFIGRVLHPLEYPDSFAYLWRQAFNVHYLWGRSLTQRAVFSLAANAPAIIVAIQLLFYLGSALLLYLCLCKERAPVRNALIGALIALVYSSYTLNLSAVVVNAEPILISLVICVPCLVALYWGPHRRALLVALGAAFILAKNAAPHVYLILLLTWLVTMIKGTEKVAVLPHTLLIVLSMARMLTTNLYDTSIHVNVLNNVYKRVLPDAEITAHFEDRYGMPVGPFVEQCQGERAGIPCFGYRILTVNPNTRNYALLQDEYGFTDWIRRRGQASYLRYFLFENGLDTWTHYREMIQWVSPQSARFMIEYVGAQIPQNSPNNLEQIVRLSPGQDRGFLGFDPLAVLYALLRLVGFGLPEVVLGYATLGMGLLLGVQYSRYLSLGVSALVSSLGMYFVTIYGDSMEVVRHTFPAWILLLLGGVFYWIGIVDLAPAIVNRIRQRVHIGVSGRQSFHGGENS